ncbi:phage major capsid protein [Bifidobacterium panos]|uniref:Major capsid protein n=1 Tax=Bifidobacterium panos TaxID=2675321 RepID=A0ABX1SYK3_9BIFI|nr:phage major capsid protein [Bifidobacterium sp. DSM 109963]NMN02364.1 major capsid protein [Bifidobacterium sp. DSM 109963]
MVFTSNSMGDGDRITVMWPEEQLADALIFDQTTATMRLETDSDMVQVPYVDGDLNADLVNEGAEISPKDARMSVITVTTRKIANLTVISRETYTKLSSSASGAGRETSFVEGFFNSFTNSVTEKADQLLLANQPTEDKPGPTGLLHTTGIVDGGNITDTLDPLLDAIATVSDNGGTPTSIIMGYDSWAYLLKLRDSEGRSVIAADVANTPTPMLYGLPVILNRHTPRNTILLNDRHEIVSAYGPVEIARTDDRYFEQDSIGLRWTFRMGFGVVHPKRLAKLTTGASSK